MESDSSTIIYIGCPHPASHAASPLDATASKVGGAPAPPLSAPLCSYCGGALMFTCQVYAPVHEDTCRTLLVFGCNEERCLRGWKVVRRQRKNSAEEAQVEREEERKGMVVREERKGMRFGEVSAANMDWTVQVVNVNDAQGAEAGKEEQQQETSLEDLAKMLQERGTKAKKKGAAKGKKKEKGSGNKDKGVILEVYEEPEAEDYNQTHIEDLLRKYNEEQRQLGEEEFHHRDHHQQGTQNAVAGLDMDVADVDPDETCDAHTDYFQARVGREPSQCLRYAYGGKPMWPTNAIARANADIQSRIPPCTGCGSQRVFELQLVPALLWNLQNISRLEEGQQSGESSIHMDWSSVLVYSCPNSCEASEEEWATALPPL